MVWRNPDFLKLWLGHAVSLFGSEITALAIPLTAILTLDAGPIEMGILAASGTTPSLIFGLAAGVWVDRVRRRPVLIASDLIRASLLLSIPAAWALGGLTLPYLVVVTFLIGVCTVLFDVAHTSYLPSVLAADELVEGNSKLEVSESLNQFAGPGAGGLIVQAVGAPLAIVADSVTFLASAAFLGRIRAKEVVVARSPTSPGVLAEASEGLRTVIAHPILRPTAGYAATGSLFMQALLAVYFCTWSTSSVYNPPWSASSAWRPLPGRSSALCSPAGPCDDSGWERRCAVWRSLLASALCCSRWPPVRRRCRSRS
jgi:MFS family permease